MNANPPVAMDVFMRRFVDCAEALTAEVNVDCSVVGSVPATVLFPPCKYRRVTN